MSRSLKATLGCVASCVVACSAATGTNNPEVGQVILQITAAPSDARCLVVKASSGGQTVNQSIDITPGQATTVQLSGVAAGTVTLTAFAYSSACSSVTASSIPTWANDPASNTVTVTPGAATQVNIVLRQTGSITSTIDWQSAAIGGTGGVGGATQTGGTATGGTSVTCVRSAGSCTAPTVTLTDVSLSTPAVGYSGEGDTAVFPMAIAAMPSGGSRLAWMGTDNNVYVATLGCDDKLTGTPFKFPAVDLQDILADNTGGVVLLTRNATNGGTDNCGTGTLCGGTSSPCRTMWMVRFNNAGAVEWETQVTNLSSSLSGYQNGARFIWRYQRHGRLAYSGTNYAAFFGAAITVQNGSCVDVHQGDRLQIVSNTGALVSSGSLAVGMSHAWTSRVLWDSRTSKFVATDATDNNCRIANPVGAVTIAAGTCDGTLFNGDVVKSTTAGYWNVWSQGNGIRLEHFTTGASDKTVSGVGSSAHPHLVSYGANNMLLTWATSTSATTVNAQVRTADANASTVGAQFTIAINDHDFGAWKSYADGSVAYAATGSSASTIKIARVMPCN